ncbi:DUF2142 domain-containing protein [Nocardioides allogilvus]|uniref:DUF2142 domain-containing protein n=1 Tax=Nocardioides allogilvus TaxID=2072017 RepID=UPI0013006082|nr:DUF2142 domain-containing protein [Nocardioides allogilvus]
MQTPRGRWAASLLPGDADTRGGLWRNTVVFWVWGALFFSLWSLATPLWSAPDSIAHDLRAYGAAHGNLTPAPPPGERVFGTTGVDRVPAGLVSSAGTAACYAFQPEVSAGCMAPLGTDEKLVRYDNPAGRYIPTYYVATGVPSLVVPLSLAMPAERVAALLISSFFLAWALAAACTMRRPAIAVTGVVIGCSPMVGYLGGVVNPNSLEITAMAAVGASSLAALLRPDSPISPTLLRHALLAGSVVCITRMISPVWLAIWLGVLLVAFGGVLVKRLLERRMLAWTALPIVASLVNCAWTFSSAGALSGTPVAAQVSASQAWSLSAARIDGGLNEVVGQFGWLDTTLSPRDYTFYIAAAVFLIGILATFVDRRRLVAIATLIAAAYFVPVAIQAAQWNSVGPVWQGRYTIPLLILVPTMAAMVAAQSEHPLTERIAFAFVPVTGLLAYVHVRAYFVQLRRNVGGASGDAFDGGWEPPLTAEVQFALLTVLVVLTWLVLSRSLLRTVERPVPGAAVPSEPVTAPA